MDTGDTPIPSAPGPVTYYIVYSGHPPAHPRNHVSGNQVAKVDANQCCHTNSMTTGIPPLPYPPAQLVQQVAASANSSAAPPGPVAKRPKLINRMGLDELTPNDEHRSDVPPDELTIDTPKPRQRARVKNKRHYNTRYSGMKMFEPIRKAISLPIYQCHDEDGVDHQYRWVPSDYIPGLTMEHPAPMVFVAGSRFQVMGQFFEITRSTALSASVSDLLRLSRACRNTHPANRTQLMDEITIAHLKSLTPNGELPEITAPYGFPEYLWPFADLWTSEPTGIPFTVRIDSNGLLDWVDTATHLWVTQVTADREYYHMNALLVLFTHRAAAMQYIWKQYLPPSARANIWVNSQPWPFRVPANAAHPCNYGSMDIVDLAAYLIFITEICQFPVFNKAAVTAVCDWADAYLAGTPLNKYAEVPRSDDCNRVVIVSNAHHNQPWIPYMEKEGTCYHRY